MGDKKTYIELNGIRYDAHTGKVLTSHESTAQKAAAEPTRKPAVAAGSGIIDGVTRRVGSHASPSIVPAQAPASSKSKPRPAAQNSKLLHSPLQKSKTLMRPAVSKPHIPKSRPAAKTTEKKPLISKEHEARLERAQTVRKSKIISRFYRGGYSAGLTKRADSVPVVAPPAAHMPAARVNAVSAAAETSSQVGKRFEQAVQDATSHLNKHHAKRKRPKRLAIISSSLAVVFLAGFFAYQNIPNLEMRVAAARAGFSASLPGYSPAGFGIAGPIKAEPGKVTVSFKSRTDNKSFQLNQQVSEWSSGALLTNYVQDKDGHVTYPDERGRTLYFYGDSNITWVDGGIWYLVEGDASLTTDQLQKIANSL